MHYLKIPIGYVVYKKTTRISQMQLNHYLNFKGQTEQAFIFINLFLAVNLQ